MYNEKHSGLTPCIIIPSSFNEIVTIYKLLLVIIIANYIINCYHHMILMAQTDILDLNINMIIRENPDERSNKKTYDT